MYIIAKSQFWLSKNELNVQHKRKLRKVFIKMCFVSKCSFLLNPAISVHTYNRDRERQRQRDNRETETQRQRDTARQRHRDRQRDMDRERRKPTCFVIRGQQFVKSTKHISNIVRNSSAVKRDAKETTHYPS